MKMVKSLLLGSAAGLVAIAGAQAADLPVKAKPVEYVKVCSLYGVGFFYIPGTDTCIKIGGYVRAEMNFNAGGSYLALINGVNARDNREVRDTLMRGRFLFSTDTRTQTEYGTLRSYTRTGFTTSTGNNNQISVDLGSTGGQTYIDRAFVQFAGFTAGRAQSFFDAYVLGQHSNITELIGSATGGNGTNLFAYTAQLGNGLSATLSLEDATLRRKPLGDLNAGPLVPLAVAATGAGTLTASDYAGHRIPDIVGNIRLDQAWGYAQVSGAAHEMRALYYTGPVVGAPASCTGAGAGANIETCGSPGNEWGFGAGAGFVLNLPFAKGDTLGVNFNWAEGAVNYAMGNDTNQFAIFNGATLGVGPVTDGIFVNGGDIIKTTAWSVVAGVEHYWTPSLRSSLYGGYLTVEYDDTAKAQICALGAPGSFGGGAIAGAGYTCDPDFKYWMIGSRSVWNPVANLDLSFDFTYHKLDTAFAGSVFLPTSGAKPAGTYTFDDQDFWTFMFRVQRNFWL